MQSNCTNKSIALNDFLPFDFLPSTFNTKFELSLSIRHPRVHRQIIKFQSHAPGLFLLPVSALMQVQKDANIARRQMNDGCLVCFEVGRGKPLTNLRPRSKHTFSQTDIQSTHASLIPKPRSQILN